MAISSTMASSAFLMSSRRMGSPTSRGGMALPSRPNDDVVVLVTPRGAARRNERGRVVLVHEQRAGPPHGAEVAAREHRGAEGTVRSPEVREALTAGAGAAGARPDRRGATLSRHPRRDAKIDELDGIGVRPMAVRPLVLAPEGLRQLARRRPVEPPGERHRQLEGLPLVLAVRRARDLGLGGVALVAQQALRLATRATP